VRSALQLTYVVTPSVTQAATNITLIPAMVPATTGGMSLVLLGINLFQEANGVLYTINNDAYNALAIVEVS